MERLIEPSEYSPEVTSAIAQIKHKMLMTSTEYTEDDIRVFEYENNIYILANPILGEEPVFDEFGKFERMVPMRNLTIIDSGLRRNVAQINGNIVSVSVPRIRILRPELCMRLNANSAEGR